MQSVISQTRKGIEYHIVDGGSTDGTLEIIDRYADRLTSWESAPDNGISDAFNKGIDRCQGALIGLINAGDTYAPGVLPLIAEHYAEEHDVIYGDMLTLVDGQQQGTYHPDHKGLKDDMTLCHPSTFIRREAYLRWGAYDTSYRLAMDYELLLRFLVSGASFYKVDEVIAHMSMDGVSVQHWKDALGEVKKAQDTHLGESTKRDMTHQLKVRRRQVAQSMEAGPLKGLVSAYRRRFSRVKKSQP